MKPDEIRALFAAILNPAAEIDLAAAALVIAEIAYPDLERGRYLAQIDNMATEGRRRVDEARDAHTIANVLSEYLFEDIGLEGNTGDYYDPRNSFLNDVLDRKLGIPITLSVVYVEVARRMDVQGLVVTGAGMPGHFLVRLSMPGDDDLSRESLMLDAFNGGVILEPADIAKIAAAAGFGATDVSPDEIAPDVTNREILSRMLNNLKAIYLDRQELPRCLEIVELALCIEPQQSQDLRLAARLRQLLQAT